MGAIRHGNLLSTISKATFHGMRKGQSSGNIKKSSSRRNSIVENFNDQRTSCDKDKTQRDDSTLKPSFSGVNLNSSGSFFFF